MSDSHPAIPVEHTLLGTTDAMVWAQEFCRIFEGREIVTEDRPNDLNIGPGTMVGWFANAIELGRTTGQQAAVETEEVEEEVLDPAVTDDMRSSFREGFDEGRDPDS